MRIIVVAVVALATIAAVVLMLRRQQQPRELTGKTVAVYETLTMMIFFWTLPLIMNAVSLMSPGLLAQGIVLISLVIAGFVGWYRGSVTCIWRNAEGQLMWRSTRRTAVVWVGGITLQLLIGFLPIDYSNSGSLFFGELGPWSLPLYCCVSVAVEWATIQYRVKKHGTPLEKVIWVTS